MDRNALEYLKQWKTRASRKPLVMRGARQVGKTFLVREFAREFENYLEINCETDLHIASYFKGNDLNEIIKLLSLHYAADIIPGKTLLFFDEIQATPELFAKLRYFYELMPDLHVIAAGSLLEFILEEHEFSMPVGRIEYLHLGPMTFSEFLLATGNNRVLDFLRAYSLSDQFPVPVHQKLVSLYKTYLVVGGMPESVKAYCSGGSYVESDRIKANILSTYVDDFNKYRKRANHTLLTAVFKTIPSLVGRKVKYSAIARDARSAEVAAALDLLCLAKICQRVYHTPARGIPLAAGRNEKAFKLLFLDVGLQCSALGLTMTHISNLDDISLVNKGELSEQFAGQHLLYRKEMYCEPEIYYWNRENPGANAEVDFVISHGPEIVPVEVKAGKTGTLKSLHLFVKERGLKTAVRLNLDIPSRLRCTGALPAGGRYDYDLISLPCYMIGEVDRVFEVGAGEKTQAKES
jgi:predicted AAA+ superfamily ATPase